MSISENPCPLNGFMKKLIFTVIIAFILPSVACGSGWQEITPQRVYNLLKEGSGLWLIDVRGAATFERVHAEGSVSIPVTTLAHKQFPKRKILVLVDQSLDLQRAKTAADTLVKNGQERVFVLSGGLRGWRDANLPVVGDGDWELSRVMGDELERALDAKVPLTVFDLRDEQERSRGPIKGSTIPTGEVFTERLETVVDELKKSSKNGLANQLKQPQTAVLVVPLGVDSEDVYQRHLWRLQRDIRVLDGGYAAWKTVRESKTVSNVEGCPTCPGQ